VGSEARDFVSEALRGNDGHFVDDPLIGVEIIGKAGIVLLDEDARCALDSLGANTALVVASLLDKLLSLIFPAAIMLTIVSYLQV